LLPAGLIVLIDRDESGDRAAMLRDDRRLAALRRRQEVRKLIPRFLGTSVPDMVCMTLLLVFTGKAACLGTGRADTRPVRFYAAFFTSS
jgi:hypothetical protein